MVLEKDGEDQLDRSCEKMRKYYVESRKGRRERLTYNKKKEG